MVSRPTNDGDAATFASESNGHFFEEVSSGAIRRWKNSIKEEDFHVHGGI